MRQVSSFSGIIPDEDEESQRLIREAITAKEHARVLQQALAFTTPAQLEEKDVIKVGNMCLLYIKPRRAADFCEGGIQEFYASCINDQESLSRRWVGLMPRQKSRGLGVGFSTPSVDVVLRQEDVERLSLKEPETALAEKAFAELLEANAELSEVCHQKVSSVSRVSC